MRILIFSLLTFAAIGMTGCDESKIVEVPVDVVPQPPQGVSSITGNAQVVVNWSGPYEADIDYYVIYRSLSATTGYVEIGQRDATPNPNLNLIRYSFTDNNSTNGTTYYYAVTSVDQAGQESELSAEEVFDTPRPDGTVRLFSVFTNISQAGFDLSSQLVVNGNSVSADLYVDTAGGVFFLNSPDVDTDIQDLGFTESFSDIGYAVDNGWSALGYVEGIVGHTYLIWTRDNHFAKVRITALNLVSGFVDLEWAYQTDQGNLELAPPANGWKRPEREVSSKPITLLRDSN